MTRYLLVGAIVLLLLLAIRSLLPTSMTHEGGSWYTTFRSHFPESGGNITLYRKTSYRGRVKVADDAYVMRVYPNDCVLYEPGNDDGKVYAACGSSRPRSIAYYPPWRLSNQWEATPEGLRRVDPAKLDSAGRVVATIEFYPIESIQRAALDHSYPIDPVVRAEAVDVNARFRGGRTALHHALVESEPEVVLALIRAGANVNAVDSSDIRPLQIAAGAMHPNAEIVEALLAAGANPCARTHVGQPLHEIVIGNPPITDRLKAAAAHCK